MKYQFDSRQDLKTFLAAEVISTGEAVKILGFSRQYLSSLVHQGKLVPIKELPRDRLFLKADIEEWNKNKRK